MVVDDHAAVREGLTELLSATPDLVVVAQCTDGRDVVETARATEPDVVVMDVTMPHVDGLEATRMLLAERPDTRVVILSGRLTSSLAEDARDAGAVGYQLKTDEPDALLRAVRAVMEGQPAWTPAAAACLGLA